MDNTSYFPEEPIEIFTITKNGGYILPLYFKHYQSSFPGCKITIFDNGSTDNTIELCTQAGCIVNTFPKFSVKLEQEFKNSIWKKSKAPWVIICDQDELCQITQKDLLDLPNIVNVIQFKGYNMIDIDNRQNPELFTHGFHSQTYDKACMFRTSLLDINFSPGSHFTDPKPKGVYSKYEYNMFHYNKSWFTFNLFCEKHPRGFKKDLQFVYNMGLEKLVKLK